MARPLGTLTRVKMWRLIKMNITMKIDGVPGVHEITLESGNRINIHPGLCAELREYTPEMADFQAITPDGGTVPHHGVFMVGQPVWVVNHRGTALLSQELAYVFAMFEWADIAEYGEYAKTGPLD